MAKKKSYPAPKTRPEGCERILGMVNMVYEYKGDPDAMSAALVDATMAMIDRVGDPVTYRARLDELAQATYDRMKED